MVVVGIVLSKEGKGWSPLEEAILKIDLMERDWLLKYWNAMGTNFKWLHF